MHPTIAQIDIPETKRPFPTIRAMRDLIVGGALPDGTRIVSITKNDLLTLAARALAVARDERSIPKDVRHAMIALFDALGEEGFFGPTCDE